MDFGFIAKWVPVGLVVSGLIAQRAVFKRQVADAEMMNREQEKKIRALEMQMVRVETLIAEQQKILVELKSILLSRYQV